MGSDLDFAAAIEQGDAERVAVLLSEPGAANAPVDEYRRRPLHLAARHGQAEIVALLIAAGADVEAQTLLGLSPLMYAARNGDVAVADALLRAGADPNRQQASPHWPPRGTPLLFAAGSHHQPRPGDAPRPATSGAHAEVFELLLANGADLHYRARTPPGSDGEGVLESAARAGRADILRLALAADTSGTLVREYGEAAFRYTTYDDAPTGHEHAPAVAMDVLYDAGVRLDSVALGGLLVSSVSKGRTPLVRRLLALGAPLHHRYQHGSTSLSLLELAVLREQPGAVGVLLEAGADPNVVTRGSTPLGDAATSGQLEIVRLLLAAGADTEGPAKHGLPALEAARVTGQPEAAALIREHVALRD